MTSTRQHALPTYDHRRGTGPTLVFLHYWGGSARTWDPTVVHLPGRDTLAVDFRGWGRSQALPGPYTLRQLADDTLAVLSHAGIEDHVLVGHSMGGKVAQLVAAMRPPGLRGIVLVGSGPATPPPEITAEYREFLSHAYDTDQSAADARDTVLTATALPAQIKAQIATDSRAGTPAARTEWPLHGIAEDITDHTRMINVPALVIAGEHDRVEPADVLRRYLVPHLSGAQFAVIPNTGHLIPVEAPGALADAITGFTPAG